MRGPGGAATNGDDDDDDYDVCRRSTSRDHFVVGKDSVMGTLVAWTERKEIDERILITAAAYLEAVELLVRGHRTDLWLRCDPMLLHAFNDELF